MAALRAHAQQRDAATADALFREARELMKAQNYEAACPKLVESQRLDPAPGTAVNLGDCWAATGRLADALQSLRDALDRLRPGDDRIGPVTTQIEELSRRVPRLTIRLAPGTPSNAIVTRDTVEIRAGGLGVGLPVNPGKIRITLAAEGYEMREYELVLKEGDRRELTLELGAQVALPAEPPRAAAQPQAMPAAGGDTAVHQDRNMMPAYVLGGVGVVSLGVGALFGLQASSKWSDAESSCGEGCGSSSPARELRDEARSAATISTVAVSVGAVALTAAGLFAFTDLFGGSKQTGQLRIGAQLSQHRAVLGVEGALY